MSDAGEISLRADYQLDYFRLERLLGGGAFGQVRLVALIISAGARRIAVEIPFVDVQDIDEHFAAPSEVRGGGSFSSFWALAGGVFVLIGGLLWILFFVR